MSAQVTYLDGLKDAACYLDTFRQHAEVDGRVDRAWALGYNLIAKMIDRHSCTDCPASGQVEDSRGRSVDCAHPKLAAPWTSPISSEV